MLELMAFFKGRYQNGSMDGDWIDGDGSWKTRPQEATVADTPTKQPRWSWHMHSQRLPRAKSANSAP